MGLAIDANILKQLILSGMVEPYEPQLVKHDPASLDYPLGHRSPR